MDILLQSDGQLYQPKPSPPPKPKPKPSQPPPQTPAVPWEELLLVTVAFLVLKGDDPPDLPLLLALGYVFLDRKIL